jgi:hypothetical protein
VRWSSRAEERWHDEHHEAFQVGDRVRSKQPQSFRLEMPEFDAWGPGRLRITPDVVGTVISMHTYEGKRYVAAEFTITPGVSVSAVRLAEAWALVEAAGPTD